MIYSYLVNKISQNTFHRIFIKNVNFETYQASWHEIINMIIKNVDLIIVITDYTDCQLNIEIEELFFIINYIKSELSSNYKLRCAVIVNNDENYTKLTIWKNEFIAHWIYLQWKICSDKREAFNHIGIYLNEVPGVF